MTFSITDLYTAKELTETNNGYKTVCSDCGLQGGRTQGFILFPETNTWYCHSSGRHGGVIELVAMKHKLIACSECLETNEKRDVWEDHQFLKDVMAVAREEYDAETVKGIEEEIYARDRPEIRLPGAGRLISKFAKELTTEIKDENILFFRPNSKEIVEVRKIKNNKGEIVVSFSPININRFRTLIEKYVVPGFMKTNDKTDELEFKEKSISGDLSSVLIQSSILEDSLPQIVRIFTVPIPIMHKGKLTFPNRGYDKRFNSWLPYDSPQIISDLPLKESRKIIDDLFCEFCFESSADRTNAIAAFITEYLRGLYGDFSTRTPFFLYLANRERAGKDYCAGVSGVVYEGVAMEDPPISDSEKKTGHNDELRKKITAAFLAGRKRMHFANNKGFLDNAVLESLITNKKWVDRILGKNDSPSFDNEMELSASGNIGIGFTPDLANRTRIIRLFLDVEDANKRKFKNPNLHGWVSNNRGLILSAIYGLVRNWVDKKQPSGSVAFASFPEWASVCGGVMEAAGYDNPCHTDKKALVIGGDTETMDMKKLFELCYEASKGVKIKKPEIRKLAEESEEDIFADLDLTTKSGQTIFAVKIKKFMGRILSGIRLRVVDSSVRASRQEFVFEKMSEKTENKKWQPGNIGNLQNRLELGKGIYDESLARVGGIPELPGYQLTNKKQQRRKASILKKSQLKRKTDRELQFFETPETENIKPKCTKEKVLRFLKSNPKTTGKELYKKFGTGSLKFRNEIIKEGLI